MQSFYRAYTLNREDLTNCTTMIQPILLKYTVDNLEPEAVALDEEEMRDDVILLLDSYFNVIEWYGETVFQWLKEKYHEV
jgi:protein transport protein SEC23